MFVVFSLKQLPTTHNPHTHKQTQATESFVVIYTGMYVGLSPLKTAKTDRKNVRVQWAGVGTWDHLVRALFCTII